MEARVVETQRNWNDLNSQLGSLRQSVSEASQESNALTALRQERQVSGFGVVNEKE